MKSRLVPLLCLTGLLAACASKPAPEPEASPQRGGCYQSDWQAETAPVIGKRTGPEDLEKYEAEHQQKAKGCP